MKLSRIPALVVTAIVLATGLAACSSDSDVASENISKDAENFKILRRIVFYNGITGNYILSIEGYCSVDPSNVGQLAVTCKTAVSGQDGAKADEYKKHYLGSGDNITWFAEQINGADVSTKHYKVIFKPSEIIPQPEVR